ncbi:glycosyltransferase family 2 protein [Thiobacillus denitrificans]
MACYNRRAITVECLQHLAITAQRAGVDYQLFLFDDGSTDGTAEAVQSLLPDAAILRGDGSYFWNRSMNRAFDAAMQVGFPAYLWLNDDTMLQPDAFSLLLSARDSAAPDEAIVVGAISDPVNGRTTYGGARYVSPRIRPFLATVVHPGPQPQDVDVVNGNLVLVPDGIARKLGNLDPVFEHGMGDTDYSMRARKLGIRIVLTAGYVGVCSRNSLKGTHRDKALPLQQRLKQIFSRKGLPWRSWLTMCWRHGGMLWPVHFLWGYTKVILGRA